MLYYRPLIKLNITGIFGPFWVSIMPQSHFAECTTECKKFEIRAHSSLSKGQMHKIFIFFQLGMVKSTKIVRTLLSST